MFTGIAAGEVGVIGDNSVGADHNGVSGITQIVDILPGIYAANPLGIPTFSGNLAI